MSVEPEEPEPPFHIRSRVRDATMLHRRENIRTEQGVGEEPLGPVFRIGGSIIQPTAADAATTPSTMPPSPTFRTIPTAISSTDLEVGRDFDQKSTANPN